MFIQQLFRHASTAPWWVRTRRRQCLKIE